MPDWRCHKIEHPPKESTMPFPITEHSVKPIVTRRSISPAVPRMRRRSSSSMAGRSCRSAGGTNCRCFAALGFRCIAPDMRGYGRSSVYPRHEDYALEHSVADMLELLDCAGPRAAPSGSGTTGAARWSGASPATTPSAASALPTCACPTSPRGFAPANFIPLVDRTVYPEAEFPAGQWEYMLFYEENFANACAAFEANVPNTGEGAVPQGQSGRPRPAVAHRPGAAGRRLVRRRRGRARPAAATPTC